MAHKEVVVALSMIAAASPVSATSPEPTPNTAPAGTPETKYCMWIEAITGTRVESVWCWTREEWAQQGVDVDKAWAKDGYKIIA
jgi:hypothetical protein